MYASAYIRSAKRFRSWAHFLFTLYEESRQYHSASCCDVRGSRTHHQCFCTFSEAEVLLLFTSARPTFCMLDPAPTRFALEFIDVLLPVITRIINSSLFSGCVPKCLKVAVVKPHLKKPGLDSDTLSNYRSVSSLSFISKLLEKAINDYTGNQGTPC